MGCGSSMDTNSVLEDPINSLRLQDPIQIVQDFVRLDEKIGKLESTCPGPRMATAEAWVEHLQIRRNELLGIESLVDTGGVGGGAGGVGAPHDDYNSGQNNDGLISISTAMAMANAQRMRSESSLEDDIQILTLHDNETHLNNAHSSVVGFNNGFLPRGDGMSNGFVGGQNVRHKNNLVASTPNKDLASLAFNLGIIGDVNKASTHEDFFANLSESALYLISLRYYSEILEHARVRLKRLVAGYAELNELYLQQDGIIAFISGGTYMSRLEENIDAQLEVARDIRDKLGSTMEQWRISGTLLRAAANSATLGLQQWRQITKIVNPKKKIQTALECRSTLQASLISLDCAQLALPHVAIKYLSQRQVLAVRHCNTYMITDIVNLSRYEHTSKVFASYESNISKASTWLYETFNKTLRKDFEKAEDSVRSLAKNLRDHREEIFKAARK